MPLVLSFTNKTNFCILSFVDTLYVNKDNYLPIYGNGSLVLGQEYDGLANKKDFEPVFDALQSFSGKISQVEMWNTILSPVEIQKLANCEISTTRSQNRILTWKTEDWKLSGQTTISDIPLKNLCQKNTISNQFIWPRKISFNKFSSYCNLMDGILPLVNRESQKKEVYNEFKRIFTAMNKTFPSAFLDKTRSVGIRCFTSKTNFEVDFWLGQKWDSIERKWYSPFFKPLEDFSEFKEKISAEGYNCGYLYANLFFTTPCNRIYPCGICEVPNDKLIYLKGLCKYAYDMFDFRFYVHGLKNNRPYFK